MYVSDIEQYIGLALLAQVDELGLTLRGTQDAILGDGSIKIFEMYAGSVIWDGQVRRVEVNASCLLWYDPLLSLGAV